jgi:tetratricopeptide (TPR) repeat protein
LLHPGTRLLLARLYLNQADLAKALPVLEQVVAEQPELASARNDLAYVLASRGEQLERALALAQSAQKPLGENPAAIDTLGYVYYRAGRLDAALTELQRAIALAGSRPGGVSPTYTYHLGLVLEALGRKPEAAGAFEQALASSDEFPEAEDARRHLASLQASATPDANAS